MKKRTPVSKIMSTDIASVNISQSIKDVSEIIETRNIRHVPVISGDEVIGMISKTDLQKISFVNKVEGDNVSTAMYDILSIDQVMTKDLMTVHASDTIHQVAEILSENEFHALPVLEDKKLVGIVTTTDLLKYLIAQF
ncbi:MAG: CBS domain-containing protein [Bacteroidia bacterium]